MNGPHGFDFRLDADKELSGRIFDPFRGPLLSRNLLYAANNPALTVRRPRVGRQKYEKCAGGKTMLWTIFVILLVLWLLGIVSSYTLGGFIHILLVIALVVLLIQLISGRRPVV
jgi:hypothetical protein